MSTPSPPERVIVGLTPALTQRGEALIDGGACVIAGDDISAVAEERLTRRKHAAGAEFALRTVLAETGVDLRDVDQFVVSTCGERVPGPGAPVVLSERTGLRLSDLGVPPERISWVPSHHLSHAYGAFETSGLDRALVIIMDDAGSAPAVSDPASPPPPRVAITGEIERTTCYLADRAAGYQPIAAFRAAVPSAGGPGTMYRYVTDFLGFDGMTESGKTMALAAYGRPHSLPLLSLIDRRDHGRATLLAGQPDTAIQSVRNQLTDHGFGQAAPRTRAAPILPHHQDLARLAQEELETAVVAMVQDLVTRTGIGDLCVGGGVALNCVLIGKLLTVPGISSVHVAAAPGDSGQPLGNMLYERRSHARGPVSAVRTPFLGPRYDADRIRRACETWGSGMEIRRGDIPRRVATAVAAGQVVAVYHGRSEAGPRALGHRSILADPRRAAMRDYLNREVKGREPFRPFGAAVLHEATSVLFGRTVASPAMMIALPFEASWRTQLPAVCHVDGTTRFQTVESAFDPWFHSILEAFAVGTGVPALLNTSFNAAGQPIVETPDDALSAFVEMKIDALAIEDWLLSRIPSQDGD